MKISQEGRGRSKPHATPDSDTSVHVRTSDEGYASSEGIAMCYDNVESSSVCTVGSDDGGTRFVKLIVSYVRGDQYVYLLFQQFTEVCNNTRQVLEEVWMVWGKCICMYTYTEELYRKYFLMTQWLVNCFQGIERILVSIFLLMSALYHGMEKKLKTEESRNRELTAQLQKRDEKLHKLVTTIHELKEVTEDNERRIEMQRNELKEQHAILCEMSIALGLKSGASFSHMYFNAGETPREFWVLRRNKQNLIIITKPHIQQIIRAALEARFVSENIGKCATKCPTAGHNCAEEFYKALQVKVGEAPHTLKAFLLLMQEKLKESESLQKLCSKMLAEIRI